MNSYFDDVKGIFSLVNKPKRPKVKLPKINWSAIKFKPSRALVVVTAILLELILIFIILWIFDERTVFANDYAEKRSYGTLSRWGWIHKGIAITLILGAIAWFFAIVNESAAYNDENRTFYKLYHRNRY